VTPSPDAGTESDAGTEPDAAEPAPDGGDATELTALEQIVHGTGQGYDASMPRGSWRSFPESALHPFCRPTVEEFDLRGTCRGVTDAWTSAAFSGRTIYMRGGGHLFYEGNEIYSFDLATGELARETTPGNAIEREGRNEYEPIYDDGTPSSAHHYANLTYDQAHDVLMMGPLLGFSDPPTLVPGVWEWDPSQSTGTKGYTRTIPGIEWRSVRTGSDYDPVTEKTIFLGDGRYRAYDAGPDEIVSTSEAFRLRQFGPVIHFDPETRFIASWKGSDVLYTRYHEDGTWGESKDQRGFKPDNLSARAGSAARNGALYFWNGHRRVIAWRYQDLPDADFVELRNQDSPEAPSAEGRGNYDKWWYVKPLDVFVGIADATEPVWVYRPPEDLPESP
jgi:hypothetical protein